MFKPLIILAILLAVLASHSTADETPDASIELQLPKCRCICRTSGLLKIITRRRCRRQRGLCTLRRCIRKGRRGVRCCIIFKLVKDEAAVDSTDEASSNLAIPYPPLGGSCGGSNVVNNFFGALALNDGNSLTRVKIAFCVASRDAGKRMFDAVVDAINRRFEDDNVENLEDARELIREEAVIADAFALAYYNPI